MNTTKHAIPTNVFQKVINNDSFILNDIIINILLCKNMLSIKILNLLMKNLKELGLVPMKEHF